MKYKLFLNNKLCNYLHDFLFEPEWLFFFWTGVFFGASFFDFFIIARVSLD